MHALQEFKEQLACLRISPALAQAVKRPSSGRLVSMKRARHANATELAGQPQISLHDTYTWDVSTQLAQKKYAKGDFIKSAEFTKLDVPGMHESNPESIPESIPESNPESISQDNPHSEIDYNEPERFGWEVIPESRSQKRTHARN